MLTSRRTTHNNASDAFVDPSEATGLYKSLSRLQPRLDSVYRKEQQVHGRTCRTSCLSRIKSVGNVRAGD